MDKSNSSTCTSEHLPDSHSYPSETLPENPMTLVSFEYNFQLLFTSIVDPLKILLLCASKLRTIILRSLSSIISPNDNYLSKMWKITCSEVRTMGRKRFLFNLEPPGLFCELLFYYSEFTGEKCWLTKVGFHKLLLVLW